MPSSYTTDLPDSQVLDSAILVYFEDADTAFATPIKFGGTRGGVTFNKNMEVRSVPFDGASGQNEGLHRYIDGSPTLTATAIVLNDERLLMLEPGSTSDDTGVDPNVVRTITPLPYRSMFPSGAYKAWGAIGKRGNAGEIAIIFPKALASFDSISGQDNNEWEIPITITAVNKASDIVGTDEVPAPYLIRLDGADIVEPV
jgi:hypothetical protein